MSDEHRLVLLASRARALRRRRPFALLLIFLLAASLFLFEAGFFVASFVISVIWAYIALLWVMEIDQ